MHLLDRNEVKTHYNGIKASDLFVKALENEGVEYIFGVPGEESMDCIDSKFSVGTTTEDIGL